MIEITHASGHPSTASTSTRTTALAKSRGSSLSPGSLDPGRIVRSTAAPPSTLIHPLDGFR
jgi:hypothetical protein